MYIVLTSLEHDELAVFVRRRRQQRVPATGKRTDTACPSLSFGTSFGAGSPEACPRVRARAAINSEGNVRPERDLAHERVADIFLVFVAIPVKLAVEGVQRVCWLVAPPLGILCRVLVGLASVLGKIRPAAKSVKIKIVKGLCGYSTAAIKMMTLMNIDTYPLCIGAGRGPRRGYCRGTRAWSRA